MKIFFAILIVLALLSGASYYLAQRLYQGFSAFFPGVRFWPILLTVCAVTLILAVGFGRALLPFSKVQKYILGLVSSYLMGIAFYLLLFTVLADLLLFIPKLLKLPFLSCNLFNGFVTLGVLLLTLVTCICGFVNATQIHHVSYEIQLHDKQDISDLNIVMISDLHLGAFGSESRLEKIVSEINAQDPDLVCIAGDFFDTDFTSIQDPRSAIETLRGLRATYGIYACLGNHDGGQTLAQMTDFLNQAGIHLLNDSYTVIDDRLILVGRLDGSAIGGYGDWERQPLSQFFTREKSEN